MLVLWKRLISPAPRSKHEVASTVSWSSPGAPLWLEQAKRVAQSVGQRKPYPSCRTQAPPAIIPVCEGLSGSSEVEEAARVCIRGTMRRGERMTPGDSLRRGARGLRPAAVSLRVPAGPGGSIFKMPSHCLLATSM